MALFDVERRRCQRGCGAFGVVHLDDRRPPRRARRYGRPPGPRLRRARRAASSRQREDVRYDGLHHHARVVQVSCRDRLAEGPGNSPIPRQPVDALRLSTRALARHRPGTGSAQTPGSVLVSREGRSRRRRYRVTATARRRGLASEGRPINSRPCPSTQPCQRWRSAFAPFSKPARAKR
jgi:hypothetical protein